MRYRISHDITYSVDLPVFFGPQLLRVIPRSDHSVRLLEHSFAVTPATGGKAGTSDAAGNLAMSVWFGDSAAKVVYESVAVVEVAELVRLPAECLVSDPDVAGLPAYYNPPELHCLGPATRFGSSSRTIEFSDRIKEQAKGESVAFLSKLAAAVKSRIKERVPLKGAGGADEVLEAEAGGNSERALVMAEAARRQGLAARFVAGYLAPLGEATDEGAAVASALHHWVEVYLPGRGWRGYDPTLGMEVDRRHVPLATGHELEQVAPVLGRVELGKDQQLTIKHSIQVTSI